MPSAGAACRCRITKGRSTCASRSTSLLRISLARRSSSSVDEACGARGSCSAARQAVTKEPSVSRSGGSSILVGCRSGWKQAEWLAPSGDAGREASGGTFGDARRFSVGQVARSLTSLLRYVFAPLFRIHLDMSSAPSLPPRVVVVGAGGKRRFSLPLFRRNDDLTALLLSGVLFLYSYWSHQCYGALGGWLLCSHRRPRHA